MIQIKFQSAFAMDAVREWSISRNGEEVASGATSADATEITGAYAPDAQPDEPVEITLFSACPHEQAEVTRTTVREIMEG